MARVSPEEALFGISTYSISEFFFLNICFKTLEVTLKVVEFCVEYFSIFEISVDPFLKNFAKFFVFLAFAPVRFSSC